ncbi:MAG: aspartate--tRNA(Asn) ligase [Candidatus Moranbacteria bacterium CG_4_10_14_3_um_filter_44_15]|nr:MAG: aspartate--tRNA(Asn) ligase [Candidatus Moranbacteria bacterium CG06_land_8_20_14_3_00_43_56]PIV83958.1 MAG: aspartate--tRNA(Asn) ligase [Candidatus Moranbacteria bacterium CG17_big_fil_post_rev_8_21_14_2_50_44_12]PIW93177.1 MAG: aspartate--tRNA(Asn) ligase [Candidatus Moranbacteria bacterium CG_4_8_14_3_um_filter_43_15]PIX90648.1 MAG: aspartate--tRNA(Asn) ligase [Candidatus Moranbacteria bacterium CG_4_10_14_3_um_filter_44_15]PJA85543.1 MAG: aspartate--tRNA(Asn) ligase [Candidatus Mora
MQRTLISETIQKTGQPVKVCGWVHVRRDHGKIIFIDLRDRSGILQCVISPGAKNYGELKKIRSQWVLEIAGTVKNRPAKLINPGLETGKIELNVKEIKILSEVEELLIDISLDDMNLHIETLLDYRNLTIRNEKVGAIFKVYAEVLKAYVNFMRSRGFLEIKTPKILSGATEGGANFFKIKYFDRDAFLAQSPQFFKQAGVGAFERVFEIGSVFRAEPHFTSRHINEFVGLDAEMGFIDGPDDVMDELEETMKYVLSEVQKNCKKELEIYGAKVNIPKKFPRLKLADAVDILKKEFKKEIEGIDIDPEGERLICEWAKKEHRSDFIFLTNYPWDIRPMYIMPNPDDPKETFGFDLLYRGIELASGGQRIHDYNQLVENMKKKKLNPDDFKYYLQIFKYGMPPHGGWGLGSERIVQKILGLKNVKEAILFPRDVKRLAP